MAHRRSLCQQRRRAHAALAAIAGAGPNRALRARNLATTAVHAGPPLCRPAPADLYLSPPAARWVVDTRVPRGVAQRERGVATAALSRLPGLAHRAGLRCCRACVAGRAGRVGGTNAAGAGDGGDGDGPAGPPPPTDA